MAVADEEAEAFNELLHTSFNSPEVYAAEAQKVFERRATAAAEKIWEIAEHGGTDKVRLDAAKYICDRVLGRIRERDISGDNKEPWAGIFSTVVREPTAEERRAGMRPQ